MPTPITLCIFGVAALVAFVSLPVAIGIGAAALVFESLVFYFAGVR